MCLHECDAALVRQLRRLTRSGHGHGGRMAEDLDRALACEDIHPNREALAVIARMPCGEIAGWALVHATGRRERTRRYARTFHYVNVRWKCYLYVTKAHRRQGVGTRLLAAAGAARELGATSERDTGRLHVCPWDRQSALFFEHAAAKVPGTWWHSWETPARFIKRR
jgi:GNAT superfamily N-acetyltransferase